MSFNYNRHTDQSNRNVAQFLTFDDLLAVLLLVQSVIGLGVAYA